MTAGADDPKPRLWRWQYVLPAIAVVAGALITSVALVMTRGDGSSAGEGAGESDVASPGATPTSTPPTAPPSTAASVERPAGPRLGRDVMPTATEPCHAPGQGGGSAWVLGAFAVGGPRFEESYTCNLFGGGVGSLDFVLGKRYRELRMRIGFADDSPSLQHTVRFEVIADDTVYVAPVHELPFGRTMDLVVDLTDRSRLKLRVTELGPRGGSGAASKPVWAGPVLTPAT